MSLISYIKRAYKYVIRGVPVNNIQVSEVTLAHNELLKSRTALITGGTSGIGFCIAKAFLNCGATVVITGRSLDRIEESCEKLRKYCTKAADVYGIVLDNIKVVDFDSKFQEILSLIGDRKIDILVNNAGVLGGHIRTVSVDEYDKIMDTNLRGVFFLSKLLGRYMIDNNIKGNILNIASASSLRPAVSAYILSKWGIRGLTLGLARALAPYGITVNGIAPGPTATPMLLKDTSRGLSRNNLLGRFVLPEEIANMAVVLVSELGRSILGDIVYMTGGSGILSIEDDDFRF